MNRHHRPTSTVKRPSADNGSEAQLQGIWLVLTRIAWVAIAFLAIGLFFASLPAYFAYLHIVNTASFNGPQLSVGDIRELQAHSISLDFYAWFNIGMNTILLLVYVFVGVVLFWRASSDRIALLASLSLVVFPLIQSVPIAGPPVAWPLLTEVVVFLGTMCIGLFFYVFPIGRFVPRWTGLLMVVWTIYWAIAGFFPATPLSVSYLFGVLFLCLLVSQVALQVYRYRRVSTPVQRQQTKWVVFGITVAFGSYAIAFVLVEVLLPGFIHRHLSPLGNVLWFTPFQLLLLLFPLSIGFAILRYRLWDIDLIINRTLVYGALTLSVIGLYVLVVVGLGTLIQLQGNVLLSLLATGVIAVLFQPLRLHLQQGVNRLMYGERDDPYAVLSRLGSRLEATLVPEKVLPAIVETIAQALKLPYVAIVLLPEQQQLIDTEIRTMGEIVAPGKQEGEIVASSGMPTADPMRVPLLYQAEVIGYLLLAARAGDTFGKADQRLLADLARQAGVAVYAVRLTTHLQRLTTSLQQARERLVTTREEERRRLRRDLHDGLGPTLASLTFKVDAARNLLTHDSARADALLDAVRQQAQQAITDIRRLVYNLRPPALDELGLLSALREQAALYQHQGLEVAFDSPSSLPPLPAAVEVAVYRIAQEALTNVARHAQAHHCLLRLAIEAEALHLDIRDDGKGIPPAHRMGVGLHTMHERASELGGSCIITPGSPGGTTIQVRLPLTAARDALPTSVHTVQPEQESISVSDMSLVRQEE
jgi:signal transduction histidine kinase